MNVSKAVDARRAVRAFTPEPVADEVIAGLLRRASRAPSGGNLQPWRIYVVGSATMPAFLARVAKQRVEPPGYEIYPPSLWEPHRTCRFIVGEQMYALLGIAREDKAARLTHILENHRFFGAPAALFCFVDRRMGPPQWSDLGMFLQTFMLLAVEAGLDTCPQEAWATRSEMVAEFVGAPEEEMLFCGVAIGHADEEAPVNRLRSDRMPLEEWARFVSPDDFSRVLLDDN
jgi:nitroreductase